MSVYSGVSWLVIQFKYWREVEAKDSSIGRMTTATFATGTKIGALLLLINVWPISAQSARGGGEASCEVRLHLDSGWVCGRVRHAEDGTPYASFRGVPYAKPPLGERRFKELEPPEPWEHLYDATEDSVACPQKDFIYSRLPLQIKGQSEDCMYLNLHLPMSAVPSSGAPPARVPVLVMVHGGGFLAGSGLTDMHGPDYFLTKEVIVITFNFRVNIFGFLSLNTAKIPGNQGLRDIITLLRWVRRNARAFGGNPDDVTLIGHSTGAICAHLVSLSKPARGLIHKVILMSGTGIPNCFSTSQTQAKSFADKFLAVLGIHSDDPDYIHERLTKEPLLNIMNGLSVVQSKADVVLLSLMPVVESEFSNITRVLDDDPLVLMKNGRGKEYPLIMGFTTDEFNYFKLQLLNTDIQKRVETDASVLLSARMRNGMPPAEQQRLASIVKRYFKGTPTLEEAVDNYSDLIFKHPALLVAEWRSYWGAPVYLYQFSYESERNIIKEANWCEYRGVAHVEDLTYVFRINSILQRYRSHPPTNNDDLMKEWLPTLFINFVRCGNPTCTEDERQWPRLKPGVLRYQDIAVPKVYKMSSLTSSQKDMMEFYDRLDVELRNIGEHLRKYNGSRY